jgi:hypothetical protein
MEKLASCPDLVAGTIFRMVAGTIFRTHDLVTLMEHVLPFEPLWEAFRQDLAYLSDFAVAYRYPGETSSKEQARDAIARCRRFSRPHSSTFVGGRVPDHRERPTRRPTCPHLRCRQQESSAVGNDEGFCDVYGSRL